MFKERKKLLIILFSSLILLSFTSCQKSNNDIAETNIESSLQISENTTENSFEISDNSEKHIEESVIENTIDIYESKSENEVSTYNSDTSEKQFSLSYSYLQKVFLKLNFNTSEEDIEQMIKEYNLEFTKQDYNGSPKHTTYKLAYTPKVALQKYADSGDYIAITFNKNDNSFMYAEYENNSSLMIALLYNYGTYWNFMFDEPENIYSGYYFYSPIDSSKEDGITFEYNNGNIRKTHYHPCDNAEETLEKVIFGGN